MYQLGEAKCSGTERKQTRESSRPLESNTQNSLAASFEVTEDPTDRSFKLLIKFQYNYGNVQCFSIFTVYDS
jgi:hypothetical protein